MSASSQSSLLSELFSSGGIGISVVRIGIGATDLSEWSYSYRDGASFSLSGPDLDYTIPILKKILAINPNIKILATPWSAPMWMKSPQPASFKGGTLDANYYDDYAQYWLDYMNAMAGQGINIWAITPQNEPLNPYNTPSMTLTKENELGLINSYIGPTLRGAGYNCKIIAYDHNCDNTDFPTYVANNSSYVDGSAFHLYAGSISALTTVKNNTNKNVYFTEQYTSTSGSFSGDLVWHTQNVTIGSMNNWSRTALEWNLATDPSYGPHTSGGCTDCKGALIIDGSTVTRNVAYYIIGHFSKFVKPDAVRIDAASNNGNLITTAFRNSDGTKVVQVLNNSGGSLTFNVVWNNSAISYTLAASSVVTFKWSSAPIGSIITLKGNNNMFVSSENGTIAMNCNRASAGTWEQFTVEATADGKVNLKSMGKYVSSENGAASGITCNRTSPSGWESFNWIVNADGKISLQGNNGKYVSSNNGASAMTCDRTSISGWEAFNYTVVGSASGRMAADTEAPLQLTEGENNLILSPNPSIAGLEHTLNLNFEKDAGDINVQLMDFNGSGIFSNDYRDVKKQIGLQLPNLAKGLYFVRVANNQSTTVKKYMIK